MEKRKLIVLGVLVIMLGGSYLLMQLLISQKQEYAQQPAPASERYVKVDSVIYSAISSVVTGKGRVVSSAEIEVVAEASGKIEAGDIPLKKGQPFQRGDILLTIYKDEMELSLKSQKSQFLNRLANLLPDIKIDFPDQYDAFLRFFNEIDLDRDIPNMPDSRGEKLKIFLSSRNVLSEYYSIKKMEKQLDRHTIYAPFKGSYKTVLLQVGAYTNTGGRIATIIHTDTVEVEVPLANGYASWIKKGRQVRLTSIEKEYTWRGTVVRISNFVDPTTQARPVFVCVPLDRQPQLFAGEYLTCEFDGGVIEDAMEIPRKAVFNYNEVFVVENGSLKKRQIELVKVNEETLIFRGLEVGTLVVVQPLINVSENTPVKILGQS
jgi:multidrug efflux pump subunit AcrA (membrane-fusion protein)